MAPWYQTLEQLRFGKTLQRGRVRLLPELAEYFCSRSSAQAPRVLFLGDGDGRLLEAFLVACPEARVTSVDISPRMVSLQKSRVGERGMAVGWQVADVEAIEFPAGRFELVVTPFFLDCFDAVELDRLIPRVAAWLAPAALWYVVDFQVPAGGLRRLWARFWLAVMHAFFRWQTGLRSRQVVDPAPILHSLGFHCWVDRHVHARMVRSTLYRRNMGVGEGR
ncbi:class I SAM-dependent methyltransferase [Rosistilla carotiformis]|uniref:class I SAM-dependent methyltransferase n=1 Tax=Rosistilla carotiformis TaxID=2528017 RepID=UPI001E513EB1|nr:class I SAM-dependent methyltransferase [Rosistilla carotiformis]